MRAADGFAQSALQPAGPQSLHIYGLWHLLLWVAIAVWVIVTCFLVAAFLRKRSSEPGTSETTLFRTVATAVAITVVTLFGLLVASVMTGNALASRSFSNPISIEVTGHQWWWEFDYDYSQPGEEIITANEMHIPVGRAVIIKTTSQDVIHSFWVPNLYGKIDAIPDHVNTIWLRADKPGVFRGQCAEFCGFQHANMAMLVYADPPDVFARWEQQQRANAAESTDPVVLRGREVFLNEPCVLCHTIRGTSASGVAGPDLTHLASRSTIAAGILPNTLGNLAG